MQVAQAINEGAWPAVLLLTALLVLKITIVRAAAWNVFLKLIGVSKTERRKLGVDAAKHDLNLREPPAS